MSIKHFNSILLCHASCKKDMSKSKESLKEEWS